MNLIFVSISFVVLISYIIYILIKVKIKYIPSLSDTFYTTRKGYLFQLTLAITAGLLIPVLLELTPDPFKILAFATTAPILFVAVAPRFKDLELEQRVHSGAALISAIFSILWSAIMLQWLFLIVFPITVLLFYILYKKYGQLVFFGEMACFTLVYTTLLCTLL